MSKLILLALSCSLFVVNCDLFLGHRTFDDDLIYSTTDEKSPVWFAVRSSDVVFPSHYDDLRFTITAVNVTGVGGEGSAGFAEVDYGGVGFAYANVHLRSERGKGFAFLIELYGVQNRNEDSNDDA